MKPNKFIPLLLSVLIMCSCGKTDSDKKQSAENVSFGANMTVSDSYAFRENDGKLYLWDLENNSYNILCTLPDCKHQSLSENSNSRCTATAPKAGYYYDYAFIYGDKLFSICSGELNEFLIYESDYDGQNKKLVLTADVSISNMVFPKLIDGKLLFVGSKYDTDNSAKMTEHYVLCTVNLTDFSLKKYTEIGIANETVLGMESLYMYDGKIYFQHCEYGENTLHSAIECVDMETCERDVIIQNDNISVNVWQYDDNEMLYITAENDESRSAVHSYNLSDKTDKLLFEHEGYLSNIYMKDSKVFYMYESADGDDYKRGAGVYDISDNTDNLTYFTDEQYVSVYGHTSNGHLILYQNADNSRFGILSDDDFWKLKFEKADFEFEQ